MYRKLLAMTLAMTISACGQVPNLTATTQLPQKIRGVGNESLATIVAARGVQIYECRTNDRGSADWAFVAPEADLFDSQGKKVGRHYAGPRWESTDGSTIAGTTKERIDAPQPDAIPWLLLSATSVGPDGSFSKVTSVQRVNTVGGAAPKTGCSSASVGQFARVPYAADYYFLAATAPSASPYAATMRGFDARGSAY